MRTRLVIVGSVAAWASTLLFAQARYSAPWEPDTEAAAEAAVARLGSRRPIDIRRSVVSIPALAGHVSRTSDTLATVEQVKRVLDDVGSTQTLDDDRTLER
jgi:hypothetical protein